VPTTLSVGSFSPSVLLDLARRTGRLAEQGLAATEVPVTSSPDQFRSLARGELDVALTSPDNVIAYRFSPGNPLGELLDARIVSAVDRGMGLGLYARPGVGIPDLPGARIGVDVPSSGFALALYGLLDSLGVDRGEVELVSLGSTPRRREALLAGDCEATMLNAGNELVAEHQGCALLASVPDVLGPYLGTVVAVVGEEHLEPAARLASALTATAADVLAGGLDEEAVEVAVERLGVDAGLARRYVDRLRSADHGLVADGVVDPAALRTLVGLRQRCLPDQAGGDLLAAVLDPESGLLWSSATR
jgi:ABC-type nitrate/sulfonate/bicarbonate transport system substrate-binding protein